MTGIPALLTAPCGCAGHIRNPGLTRVTPVVVVEYSDQHTACIKQMNTHMVSASNAQ